MTSPLVTVGLPFYNSESTLGDAIRSVFAQRFQDWELIMVDDGSRDASLGLAKAVRDPRVHVYSDGVNRELSVRLNQINDLARGKYVARMDADDLMHSDRLWRQVEILEANPDLDLVSTAMFSMDDSLVIRGIRGEEKVTVDTKTALERGLFCHATIVARAEWARKNRYDPNYPRAEDLELWCRVARTLRAAQLPDALYFCREPRHVKFPGYLHGSRTKRAVLDRYGPPTVGVLRTQWLKLSTLLKELTYRLSSVAGLDSVFIDRRNHPLDSETLARAAGELAQLRRTPVPGLEAN